VVDAEEYDAVLGHAVVGIVTLQPGVGDSIVPSKLLGYIGAGLPVIVLADPESEAAQLVRGAECGTTLPPGRGDLLAQAVMDMVDDRAKQAAMAARGRALATTAFTRDRCVDMFQRLLSRLTIGDGAESAGWDLPGTEEN
jgi:colanic acid biosynthesis glycosyl transferase WcaI